tara:strand:- start:302 stop:583 length:282 start_codon:yes stop_codon:yes gene_type:complete
LPTPAKLKAMSLVITISKNKKIILPKNRNNQDKFMGLWLQAQQKAIRKVIDEFIIRSYSQEQFDQRVDEVTYDIYKQLKNGGNSNVYRRELET